MSGGTTTAVTPEPAPLRRSFTRARAPLLQRKCACGGTPVGGGECEECRRKKQMLQRHAARSSAVASVPPIVQSVLHSPGQPLDRPTRDFMESRFGHDFSQVRVHTDAQAAESARAVDAHAYTVGQDIAFARGSDSHSAAGRHLLAHELAHTIQQSGLQRSSESISVDQGAEYQGLEREAEAAAGAVMRGESANVRSPASQRTLSRAKSDAGKTVPPKGKKKKKPVLKHVVTPLDGFERENRKLESFGVDKLHLPASKGPQALDAYKSMAGKGLEATLNVDGRTKAALWQERAGTEDLRKRWLDAVGWTPASADALWQRQEVGGDKEFPKVGGEACQMDHIVELQIGGNNTNENIQALDGKQNRESGGAIKNQVFALAQAIVADADLSDGSPEQVNLKFAKVELQGTPESVPKTCPPAKKTCLSVETCGRKLKVEKTAKGETKVSAVDYSIYAGGIPPTKLKVPTDFPANRKAPPIAILDSSENKAAAELIPGLLLDSLEHKAGAKGDALDGDIDTRDKTRLPLTIEKKKKPLKFNIADDGKLTLDPKSKTPGIAFTYAYLSPGVITSLTPNESGGLDWAGHIDPRISFLGRLDVSYSNGELKVTKGVEPSKIKIPFPGVKLKKAELALVLAPEFKPSGTLSVVAGPESKPLAQGDITVTKDDEGLLAKGTIRVFIPGVDETKLEVTYKGGEWSGQFTIASSQIKLPYVKSGSVTVMLTGKAGITATGDVQLGLPGGNEASVGIKKVGEKWVFSGTGKFKLPKLDDTNVSVTYDGETLHATGKTGFTFYGLRGTLDPVTYRAKHGEEGKISGTGKLSIHKGRANGEATIKLSEAGKFSGAGKVTYKVSDKLTTEVGIVVDEHEKVRLSGALKFAEIKLFEGIHGERSLFDIEKNIPIPGASVGPVGVQAKIGGGVSIGYGIGPGVLRNVFIEAAINPLDDNPDIDAKMGARLEIPAYAKFGGYIKGGIALDVLIGEVAGGLTISASLTLKGGIAADFAGRYSKHRFEVDASAEIFAGLILGLGLTAWVLARAGIGPVSVETRKDWDLKKIEVPTGIDFKLRAPIHYASDQSFKAPSLNDIEWSPPPKIDPADLLKRVFEAATATEKKT